MTDDFEEYLRAARPAEPPPELMRRLRQAAPAAARTGVPWLRWASLGAMAVATMTLLGILADSRRLVPGRASAPQRHASPADANGWADDDPRGFGGSVAMNLQLGATPNLTPVSLRPNYDPRAPRIPAGLLVANPISESAPRF